MHTTIIEKNFFKSFDDYLDNIINDADISEIYYYDLLLIKIKKVFNSEILVLPLEELENNYKSYIDKIGNFLNIELPKDIYTNISVNKNSKF